MVKEKSGFGVEKFENDYRLGKCKALLGKTFDDRATYSSALQVVKGKLAICGKSTSVGTMKALGAIASGTYKGKASVILLEEMNSKGQLVPKRGNERKHYAVNFLDKKAEDINWESVKSVGSLSK